jgi:hypothetical protein
MPALAYQEFPDSVIVLAYIATISLLVILILLFRMNGRIAALSAKLNKTIQSIKSGDSDTAPNVAEAEPGTPFDEFLNEDPDRRSLAKKEQFKAYRKWRAEKGLNWSS